LGSAKQKGKERPKKNKRRKKKKNHSNKMDPSLSLWDLLAEVWNERMVASSAPLRLVVCYAVLLSVERLLYGYWFHFPHHFKVACTKGVFGSSIQHEPVAWRNAMTLGGYVKIFQFGVAIYDLGFVCQYPLWNNIHNTADSVFFSASRIQHISLGLILIVLGQGLNIAVFRALGAKGVYYGSQFGYNDVPWVQGFPYNLGISDPQYWGVIWTIWGIYILVGASSWLFPVLETFWYVLSMQLLEHSRGHSLAKALFPSLVVVKE
jgi:hypothetical protein